MRTEQPCPARLVLWHRHALAVKVVKIFRGLGQPAFEPVEEGQPGRRVGLAPRAGIWPNLV